MKVCYELECSHAGYCDASRFLMSNSRCDMSTFLKGAHKTQQKENEEAQKQGMQYDDNEVTAAVCSGLKSYASSCYQGRGRKTNKQRRKMSIACGYLSTQDQRLHEAGDATDWFSRGHIKADMKKYK